MANRVAEIHEYTDKKNWVHVRSELNPADLPSRGCKLQDLNTSIWFTGPEFLCRPESEWPDYKEASDSLSPAAQVEVKKTVVTNTVIDGDLKLKPESSPGRSDQEHTRVTEQNVSIPKGTPVGSVCLE